MLTIDAQVHSYERDHPGRPWHAALTGPPEVTGDQMVAAMDAAGVDGAILVSAFTMYRYDASYALEVRRRHSGRFAVIKPVDPADPAVAAVIAEGKDVTYDMKADRNDPTSVGTQQMAEAICARIRAL